MQMATTVVDGPNPMVLIGPEFVPRGLHLPVVKVVQPGEIWIPTTTEPAYDYIEISSGGTLQADRHADTVLRVTTLINMPATGSQPKGRIDTGTDASPMFPGSFTFIGRDVPIDVTVDPFHWGNGLLNFGDRYMVGPKKDPWGVATGDIAAGATTVTLSAVPFNWEIGDEILIPDSAPQTVITGAVPPPPRRETLVTILDMSGAVLTLSKPLDFEHLIIPVPPEPVGLDAARLAAYHAALAALQLTPGGPLLYPRVFNLTRKHIILRSENPLGTRWHQADIGAGVMVDVDYNETHHIGRTTIQPLDSTVFASPFTGTPTHIGANQIAKYNAHFHHCNSIPGSCVCGNVWRGDGASDDAAKWALSVHSTSDLLVQDNIAVDFPGAGIVTEDGNEVRNVFDHNAVVYSYTYAIDASGNFRDAQTDVQLLRPGCEGTDFWFHGVGNTFTRNEAWNGFSSGFNLFNQQNPPNMLYPSAPGAMPDTPFVIGAMLPVAFADNVTACHSLMGMEVWAVNSFPLTNLIAAYSGQRQLSAPIPLNLSVSLDLVTTTLIGVVGNSPWFPVGVHSGIGYVANFMVTGGLIAGNAVGIDGGGGNNPVLGMSVIGTILQNVTDVGLLPPAARFENVLHVPLGTSPHQYLNFGDGRVWNGTDPLPEPGINAWAPQIGSRLLVKNWQGTGKDKRLFTKQSLGSAAAWYSIGGDGVNQFNCPVKGLTMQQSWDQFGLAYGGGVCPDADAETLDGLVNGLALDGLITAFPPPRAILTFPTIRESAVVNGDGTVSLYLILTGDPALASNVLMWSVDGGTPGAATVDETRGTFVGSGPGTVGTHTVQTWRTTIADPTVELTGSRFTGNYAVGVVIAPPPPTMVMVPNLVGLSQVAATAALTAVGLIVGTVTADIVSSQTPAADTSVSPGTAVNLVIT